MKLELHITENGSGGITTRITTMGAVRLCSRAEAAWLQKIIAAIEAIPCPPGGHSVDKLKITPIGRG